MNDATDSLREVTLHNGVNMPTLAFGCAFGDWVGATDFQEACEVDGDVGLVRGVPSVEEQGGRRKESKPKPQHRSNKTRSRMGERCSHG